ncbi:MAG: CHAD domain-containing protein [Stappiaceae bacterium]
MSAKSLEIELKFTVSGPTVTRLRAKKIAAFKQVSRAVTQNLRSVYFDTPDLALKNAGISFRVRHVGRAWIQTVKIGTGLTGGLSKPQEIEITVSGPNPDIQSIYDPEVRDLIANLIGEASISPVFETTFKRLTRLFESDDGDEIEVAFDQGKIIAGGAERDLSEIELELKKGRLNALYTLAHSIFSEEPWRFSSMSKAAQGYRLALQDNTSEYRPQKARKSGLADEDTAEDALEKILRSCLKQIMRNAYATFDEDRPEGPHQLRVGLRRLRSALKLFGSMLEPEFAAKLAVQAREIAAVVGDLRDLDVLIDEIIQPCEAVAPSSIDLQSLIAELQKRRETEQARTREVLSSTMFRHFLLSLGQLTETQGWRSSSVPSQKKSLARPARKLAKKALLKSWRRTEQHAALLEQLSIEERHVMRKDLKKLRYAIEFFLPLYDKKQAKPFLKKLKLLQDMFGYLNDVAIAEKIPGLIGPRSARRGLKERAAGFVLGWHQSQADNSWTQASELWHGVAEENKFWMVKHNN